MLDKNYKLAEMIFLEQVSEGARCGKGSVDFGVGRGVLYAVKEKEDVACP